MWNFIVPKVLSFRLETYGVSLLLVIEELGLDLALCFQGAHNILVLPAHLVWETAQNAVGSSRLQLQGSHARRHNHSLALVVWSWHALEALESLQGFLSSLRLVWNHTWLNERSKKKTKVNFVRREAKQLLLSDKLTSDGSPEDLAWGSEVNGTTVLVDGTGLVQEGQVLDYFLVTEKNAAVRWVWFNLFV